MKKRAFYVFDEHTDYIKACEKIGMKAIGDKPDVKHFLFGETEYEVLFCHDCFSGWQITVMELPELSFAELLQLVMSSRCYDEIVGGIGMILKKHSDEFVRFLSTETSNNKKVGKIKKIIKKEISERNPEVKAMTDLLALC